MTVTCRHALTLALVLAAVPASAQEVKPPSAAEADATVRTVSSLQMAKFDLPEPSTVCLGPGATLCVPLSVLRATFEGWKDGDISPLAREQAAHADTYARWRNAEHELAKVRAELMKLSAPKEAEGLDQVRAAWLKSVQDAAPPGTVFDEKTGKYVPKPAAKKGGSTP